ncbi:MAG: hypothetical protein A2X08_06620 [Bacteroidetes bacterium GWA2_32_17]|nr:MAG: hypothetical protein A2X08_06620 [Bacteroidetes bacterium GWA2_32_17]
MNNANAAILAVANQTSNKINFNGDDAIQLVKVLDNIYINIDSIEGLGQNPHAIFDTLHLDTLDQIGIPNVTPGNGGWTVDNNGSTKNSTLIRNYGVSSGQSDWDCGKYQWQTLAQDNVTDLGQHQNVCEQLLTNDISFSFSNPTETGTNPKYFEFDVIVQANNSSTYFDNCVLYLLYNTNAFGESIVFNNTVTITRGANFNSATYIDPNLYIADDSTSVMRLPFGTDIYGTSWNRTLVTTTPNTLLHVKIEIQNCNEYSLISFIDTNASGLPLSMFSLYSLNASDDPNTIWNVYDNTFYLNDLNQELCPPPIITNMLPNSITSGTNSVLTIQGSNFGNTRGTSQLWLCVDENCSFTITYFDYIDYLSWSNTEIKFIVPSTVDTLDILYHYKGVGSGNVFVWRSDGVTTVPNSVSHLEVSYANKNRSIRNYTTAYKKVPMRVIPDYGDTTKYFYLDTSITNSPMRDIAVRTALRRWSCNTFINWAIKDTIIAQNFEDNISVLYMDDSFHGNPLGRTYFPSIVYLCADDNGDTIGYFKDIDIGYSRDFNNVGETWLYDTSYTQNLLTKQHDFFAVAQHELGHAHGLDHVNDTTDIMNYVSKMGPVNYYNRLDIYSSPDAVNGGNYIFQKSQQIHSCSGITQMIPFLPSNCSSYISELFNNDVHLFAYPNPLNDVLYVTYNLNRSAILNFTMYDYTGNKIKQINLGKQNIGSHNIKINVSNISSGLYFLSVKINNRVETIKLIKM